MVPRVFFKKTMQKYTKNTPKDLFTLQYKTLKR